MLAPLPFSPSLLAGPTAAAPVAAPSATAPDGQGQPGAVQPTVNLPAVGQVIGQDWRRLENWLAPWLKKLMALFGPAAAPAGVPAPATPPATPVAPSTYTVQPGDSLGAIARRLLGDANRWREIYDLNRQQISNPNLIFAGQVLQLPGAGPAATPAPAPAAPPAPAPSAAPSAGQPWQPGPGRLQGADTSNWQSAATFASATAGTQWSAIKASQGTGFVDPSFQARWNTLGQAVQNGSMKLRMAYCYLDSGDGAAQARHFLDVVGIHGPMPAGTRLALDWEGSALASPDTLAQAANTIHEVTGNWPVIYVQGSKMAVAQQAVPQAPIWEAAWGPNINPNVPFVQYSDGPGYDHDVFNGDAQALARFAGWA